jgi:hypothetical protein
MGTRLNPDAPRGRLVSKQGHVTHAATARARETAEYERDVDPLAILTQPRPFRPWRRKRKKTAEVVPHLRHGRFPREIERMLEREKPELSEPDEAELERLLAKHADIAGGRCLERARVVSADG